MALCCIAIIIAGTMPKQNNLITKAQYHIHLTVFSHKTKIVFLQRSSKDGLCKEQGVAQPLHCNKTQHKVQQKRNSRPFSMVLPYIIWKNPTC